MSRNSKIQDLGVLAETIASLKAHGKTVVQSHGVFDLLHLGHIRHFEEARKMGDVLVVTLTRDEHVNKGPNRPAFSHDFRAEAIAALGAVDYVAINASPLAVEAIQLLKPNIYVKGPDYKNAGKDITGGIVSETEAVRSVGGEMRFTDDVTFSSSNLLNRYFSSMPDDVQRYLEHFRRKYSVEQVFEFLESFASLRVLVVGEAILDEYVYCDAMGKSSKEPIIAMRYLSRETYPGGALAVANHLAAFCGQVGLVTYLGTMNSSEEFVRGKLKSNVHPFFIRKPDSPTIVKRRFVEKYLVTKMLEVYEMNDDSLKPAEDEQLCKALTQMMSEYDLVIAADFGHGLITQQAVDLLCSKAKFLAVNTQINAANIGFHAVSKYRRADYVCIQEGEIRLDRRNRSGDLETIVKDLADRLSCRTVMVTRGKMGTLLYRRNQGAFECPSFAVKVVDRIGAGDAVLAITSACAYRNMPPDVTGFIANLVGAQIVGVIGNSSSLDRVPLLKSIESMLK
jgi:rfaE bifunctional protein kinase chain/domain/rfaE bifunctional protein nucleotidyltransferase chain/domain